jgi:hypothetical protein
MPDNNFEKRLQEQMEGFKLQPSEQVWDEVELRIRKKKNRRRIIFWWLVPALLAGGGLFTAVKFLNNGDKKTLSANEIIKTSEKENITTAFETSNENDPSTRTNTGDNNSQELEKRVRDNKVSIIDKSSSPLVIEKTDYQQKKFVNSEKDFRTAEKMNRKQVKPVFNKKTADVFEISAPDLLIQNAKPYKADDKVLPEKEPATEIISSDITKQLESNITPVILEQAKIEPAVINLIDSTVGKNSIQNIDIIKDNADSANTPAPNSTVKLKKKWQFGLSFDLGASDLRKSLIPGIGSAQKSADLVLFQSPVAPGFAPIPKAAEERRGAAFKVKAFMQKNIRRRLDLQTGISYSYFSTVTNVGNRVNVPTALNYVAQDVRFLSGFYNSAYTAAASSVKNDYINRYHLAGLYGQLNWRITNWKKKAAIYWNNGLSINQLFASNALVYDPTGSVYYKNFEAYQKQMAGMSSALSFRFFNSHKFSITAGPFMQYYLTPQLKDAVTDNKYFRNYGINMQVLFKK